MNANTTCLLKSWFQKNQEYEALVIFRMDHKRRKLVIDGEMIRRISYFVDDFKVLVERLVLKTKRLDLRLEKTGNYDHNCLLLFRVALEKFCWCWW